MSYQSKHGSGFYDRPCTHLVRDLNDSNAYASKDYTYVSDGNTYYCHVEQTGSTEVEMDGRLLLKTAVKINVRNWVSLSVTDRLLDNQFGDTYIFTSVVRANDEWIVEGYHL